jgi:hypothetical protein
MKIAGRKRHGTGVSSRKFNARTSLKSQVISNGIYGGQIGTGTEFPESTAALPSQYYSTSIPHSFIYRNFSVTYLQNIIEYPAEIRTCYLKNESPNY